MANKYLCIIIAALLAALAFTGYKWQECSRNLAEIKAKDAMQISSEQAEALRLTEEKKAASEPSLTEQEKSPETKLVKENSYHQLTKAMQKEDPFVYSSYYESSPLIYFAGDNKAFTVHYRSNDDYRYYLKIKRWNSPPEAPVYTTEPDFAYYKTVLLKKYRSGGDDLAFTTYGLQTGFLNRAGIIGYEEEEIREVFTLDLNRFNPENNRDVEGQFLIVDNQLYFYYYKQSAPEEGVRRLPIYLENGKYTPGEPEMTKLVR